MSNMVVEGYNKVLLKSVTVREREGKKPLVFLNFHDVESLDETGDMILLKDDISMDFIMNLKALEKKPVSAVIRLSTYNGRSSLSVSDVLPIQK